MSSPRRRRHCPPPELPDDAIRDIFLRIPPEEPARLVCASLVCASLVCKPWRRILSDPAFCRAYREFHFHRRRPPLLGFLHNDGSEEELEHCVLVPTTAFLPPGGPDRGDWSALDSRHGRVLLHSFRSELGHCFVVWDPITDAHWRLPMPHYESRCGSWSATVLCAMDGCNHTDCHGGPFLVAFVALNNREKAALASVYSSESGGWSDAIYVEHPDGDDNQMGYLDCPDLNVLVGKTAYFPSRQSYRILEYDIAKNTLSVMATQFQEEQETTVLVAAEDDGALVFAGLEESSLHVWSREASEDGAVAWLRHKVIHLDMLVTGPGRWIAPRWVDWEGMAGCVLVGSADGFLFLSTHDGSYTIEISSGQVSKLTSMRFTSKIIPYRSFYTLDHAMGIMHHCCQHVNPSA